MPTVRTKTVQMITDAIIAEHIASAPIHLRDQITRGLVLYAGKNARTWRAGVFWAGRNLSIPIGTYPSMTIMQARGRTEEIRTGARAGVDPRGQSARARFMTLDQLIDQWVAAKKIKARKKWAKSIRKHFAPLLSRPIAHLTLRELQTTIDAVLEEKPGAGHEAGRRIRQLLKWAVKDAELLDRSPADKLFFAEPGTRDRVATVEELQRIWQASEAWETPHQTLIRLCILIGSRVSETSEMRFADVDYQAQFWTVPAATTKTRVPMRFALSRQALDVIRAAEAKRWGPFVCGPRRGPKLLNAVRYRLRKVDTGNPPVTIHDFRRSIAVIASENGFDRTAVDKQLNHVAAGSLSLIDRAYHQTDFLAQRLKMAQAHADRILAEMTAKGLRKNAVLAFAKSEAE